MKALLIALSIVSAWISGAAIDDNSTTRQLNGAVWLLTIAILCGLIAWRLK